MWREMQRGPQSTWREVLRGPRSTQREVQEGPHGGAEREGGRKGGLARKGGMESPSVHNERGIERAQVHKDARLGKNPSTVPKALADSLNQNVSAVEVVLIFFWSQQPLHQTSSPCLTPESLFNLMVLWLNSTRPLNSL